MTTLIKSAIKRMPGAWQLRDPIYSTQLVMLRLVQGGDAYRKAVFRKIWSDNYWGDQKSLSGGGSNLHETAQLRIHLANLIDSLQVDFLLDLPCGDFHWMKEVRFPSKMSYLGGDIVEPLVERNQGRYGSNTRRFSTLDILRDRLPPADLILCRDCLVHFSYSDIFTAIANLKRSRGKYLLMTHFTGDRTNGEISTGDWRPLNFTRKPFNFPPPMVMIDEQCSQHAGLYNDKCLGLWRLEDLPD